MPDIIRRLAVYIDVDNAYPRFSSNSLRFLFDRLAGVGTTYVCRAYADWNALGERTKETMRWAVTPVHLYTHGVQRKNAADIAVAVDAMEAMLLTPELDTFVLVTGDADLAPLATRLKERGKTVLGFGRRASSSQFLVRSCHRFEYLEDLEGGVRKAPAARGRKGRSSARPERAERTERDERTGSLADTRAAVVAMLKDLVAESGGAVHAGLLKQRFLERQPAFREKAYGAKTFAGFLELIADEAGLAIERTSSGMVRVGLAGMTAGADAGGSPADEDDRADVLDPEDARDLLLRALNTADEEDAGLGWLKETMLRMSPSFNERGLGFRRFIDFASAQDDLVEVVEAEPNRWVVRPIEDR